MSKILQEQLDLAQRHAMLGMDIPWMLGQWAERTPDKPFMIWEPFAGEPVTLTYSQFQSKAKAAAAGLYQRGLRQGDFLLLHMENSPEFLVTWFACAMLGTVVVSTNTRSVARDLSYFAEHTKAVCAVTQPGSRS
jgi:carnitine-CoA ligase